jgi:ParB-like chromosome segregation protein Spo0J
MKITKTYETVPIGKLVPYARNAREHDAKQVAQIRASFREFGTLNPCLVDGVIA